jgi:8-oxo-dGTP pyrophosphatase MutT (NUDIX family)
MTVLLITSRTTRRWTIPKGWPMKGMKDHKAAEREALEESGVVGQIGKTPIGKYQYWKRNGGTFHLCEVSVYSLRFDRQVHKWREKGQRSAEWFSIAEAATLVQEPGLKAIIERLAPVEPAEI